MFPTSCTFLHLSKYADILFTMLSVDSAEQNCSLVTVTNEWAAYLLLFLLQVPAAAEQAGIIQSGPLFSNPQIHTPVPKLPDVEVWFVTPENACPLESSALHHCIQNLSCKARMQLISHGNLFNEAVYVLLSSSFEGFHSQWFSLCYTTGRLEYSALHRHPVTVPRRNVLSSWQRPILSQT